MNLFFLRHGKMPIRAARNWRPDSLSCPLTHARGKPIMFDVARRALSKGPCGLSFDAILTSPYARALLTAEILAAGLSVAEAFRDLPPVAGRWRPGNHRRD